MFDSLKLFFPRNRYLFALERRNDMHPRNPDLEAKDLHPKVQNGSMGRSKSSPVWKSSLLPVEVLKNSNFQTFTFILRLAQELTQVNTSRDPQTRKSLSKQIVQILKICILMQWTLHSLISLLCVASHSPIQPQRCGKDNMQCLKQTFVERTFAFALSLTLFLPPR